MNETRLNKRVSKWNSLSRYKCKNWNFRIEKIFQAMDIVIHLPNIGTSYSKSQQRYVLDLITVKVDAGPV